MALVELAGSSSPQVGRIEAHLRWVRGWLGRVGGFGETDRQFQRSLELYRAAGDRAGAAQALCDLGRGHFVAGDYAEATRCLEGSAAICRELRDSRGLAEALLVLSWNSASQGRLAECERLARESLSIRRELGDATIVASGLTGLAWACAWSGRYAESLAHAKERVTIYEGLGVVDSYGLGWVGFDCNLASMRTPASTFVRCATLPRPDKTCSSRPLRCLS
jgi:tetratricopeptide (TPR) repeat protein